MQSVESSIKGHKNDRTRQWLYKNHYRSELGNMPELKRNAFMISWMYEVGFYGYGGTGIVPISHSDIMAWRYNMAVTVEPEDVMLMLHLSKVYVGQLNKSKDRDEPSPVVVKVKDQSALANRIKSGLRSSASTKKPS